MRNETDKAVIAKVTRISDAFNAILLIQIAALRPVFPNGLYIPFQLIYSSLRSWQQASELQNVQRKLGRQGAVLRPLSQAATNFDSSRLVAIIHELNGQLSPFPLPAHK